MLPSGILEEEGMMEIAYGGVIMSDVKAIQTGGAVYNEGTGVVQPVKSQNISTAATKAEVEVNEPENTGKEANANGLAKSTVKNAVETANESLKVNRTSARFKYHEATKQVSIKIIDDVTQEVIKEIPPEKSIEMVEKMLELSGILVDEKR